MSDEGKVSVEAQETLVGNAYAVVHSAKHGLLFIEDLTEATWKNFRSFREAAGEDWQIIGIFEDIETAYRATCDWLKTPGSQRRDELGDE